MDLAAWFQELRRRRVIRALLGWGLLSFAVLQVIEPLQHALGLGEWFLKAVVAVLAVGFPATAGLAWAFDLTRRGIERTAPAEGTGRPRRAGRARPRPWPSGSWAHSSARSWRSRRLAPVGAPPGPGPDGRNRRRSGRLRERDEGRRPRRALRASSSPRWSSRSGCGC